MLAHNETKWLSKVFIRFWSKYCTIGQVIFIVKNLNWKFSSKVVSIFTKNTSLLNNICVLMTMNMSYMQHT